MANVPHRSCFFWMAASSLPDSPLTDVLDDVGDDLRVQLVAVFQHHEVLQVRRAVQLAPNGHAFDEVLQPECSLKIGSL